MVACLERVVPEKLLSDIDKAIDSGDINKAYELVGCSNPEHHPLSWIKARETGCKECSMLGIEYKGVDSDIAQYPGCALREYVRRRRELKDKITGKE